MFVTGGVSAESTFTGQSGGGRGERGFSPTTEVVAEGEQMLALVLIGLIVWLVLVIVGLTVKGLVWLAIIGIVLFLVTVIFGFLRRVFSRR